MIAYNKVDVPDSGDYWEDVRDYLVEQGVPADNIFAISAASGRGVTDLVRRVRALLDTMGSNEPQPVRRRPGWRVRLVPALLAYGWMQFMEAWLGVLLITVVCQQATLCNGSSASDTSMQA